MRTTRYLLAVPIRRVSIRDRLRKELKDHTIDAHPRGTAHGALRCRTGLQRGGGDARTCLWSWLEQELERARNSQNRRPHTAHLLVLLLRQQREAMGFLQIGRAHV